jgi:hypothetical protein
VTILNNYNTDNEYVSSLNRSKISAKSQKRFYPDSILWLILKKTKELLSGIKAYAREIFVGRTFVKKIIFAKNSKIGKPALVIGGGPSCNNISPADLERFQTLGGEIFVVNHWNDNSNLSSIIPDHIVFSCPSTMNRKNMDEKQNRLQAYLLSNKKIKIYCPILRVKEISELTKSNNVVGFIDSEMRTFSNNIAPIFPRGYISNTLYKALGIALWFNYDQIYLIGMDNTYPRTIYSDVKNSVLNLEEHGGQDDEVLDFSELYSGIGDYLLEISYLFYDAKKFNKKNKIVNLDIYSLTDAFVKMPLSVWRTKLWKKYD